MLRVLFDLIHASRKSPRQCFGSARLRARICRPIATLALGICLLNVAGCARRAYTDVYVESMASEIRDLEDQLYEFDSEYRVLEQELDVLQSENARLRGALPGSAGSDRTNPGLPQKSPLGAAGAQPRLLPVPGSNPSGAAPGTQAVPGIDQPGVDRPGIGQPSAAPPLYGTPSDAPPLNPLSPSELPAPKSVPGADSRDPYDFKDLVPPTIERGEAMPPTLPPPKSDASGPLTLSAPDELEIQLGQISLPGDLTAGGRTVPAGGIAPATEMPRDTRIVEIKFHPSLCRAVNVDGEGDDDGLSLVLQPLNSEGQFVPLPADLIVVAIDPSRENAQRPTGRWTYKAADIKAKLQPVGSSQGIHLSLPWNGPEPQADRLVVFAYYTLPDGRRIVAEQEIFLNNGHRQHTVWVPRAKAAPPGGKAGPVDVQTASGQRPVQQR